MLGQAARKLISHSTYLFTVDPEDVFVESAYANATFGTGGHLPAENRKQAEFVRLRLRLRLRTNLFDKINVRLTPAKD